MFLQPTSYKCASKKYSVQDGCFLQVMLEITAQLPFMLSPPMPSSVVKFCRERVLNLGHFFTGMCLQTLPDLSASLSVGASIGPILPGNSCFFSCCVAYTLHITVYHHSLAVAGWLQRSAACDQQANTRSCACTRERMFYLQGRICIMKNKFCR